MQKKSKLTKHTVIRTLGILMAAVTVSTSIPMDVGAAEKVSAVAKKQETISEMTENEDMQVLSEQENVTEQVTKNTDVTIVEEAEELRGEYEKHFINSDGSYTAVTYEKPVHFYEEGEWKEVDNTLQEDGDMLVNTDGVVDVSFANEKIGETNLVTIEKEGYRISWKMEAEDEDYEVPSATKYISKSIYKAKDMVKTQKITYGMKGIKKAGVIKEKFTDLDTEEKKTVAKKLKSKVAYEDLFCNNVDINYTLEADSVKEDIVLNEKTDIETFVMELDLEGLKPFIQEDNSILFSNEKDELVFVMPAPFMVDSAKGYSEDIVMDITEEDGRYILRLTPDKEWLNAEERVYPVTIDPTVSPANVSSNVRDTYIYTGDSTKHNNETTMYMGLRNNKVHRTFIKYTTMPTINGSITGATLKLTVTPTTSTYGPIAAYKVNSNWDSATITWANQPTSLTYLSSMSRSGTVLSFNVLSAVKGWYTGSTTGSKNNYGFAIKYSNEAYKDYNRVYTAESSANRPVLNITYVTTSEVSISVGIPYVTVDGTRQVNYTVPSGFHITWTSSNTDVATVSSSGLITGEAEGSALITATYRNNSGNVYTDSLTIRVYDSIGIKNNTEYYIMNKDADYIRVSTVLDTNNTNVVVGAKTKSDIARWKVEKQANGQYKIVNVKSSTGKVLNVTGTNIDIYADEDLDSQLFSIIRINTGIYQGMYYIRYGNYYLTYASSGNNVYLATTATTSSIWSFMASDIRTANYYSINTPCTNTNYGVYSDSLSAMGYMNYNRHCVSAATAYAYLKNTDDIFIFSGHGAEYRVGDNLIPAAAICFQTSLGADIGMIRVDEEQGGTDADRYINNLSKNALALSRCVLYVGCSTGVTYTDSNGNKYNLVDAAYEKGAHYVLGTKETINTNQADIFVENFLAGSLCGNIENAIDISTAALKAENVYFDIYEKGDKNQYLKVS